MYFLITPFVKDVCILLGIACIGLASVVQAAESGMNRNVNRYLVVSGTAGGHMEWVYFDTRAAADGAYDAIKNGDSRVLMDTHHFERAAGVLRRDAVDAFVQLVRRELREQEKV
jgi:hypothetical protein